MKPLQPSCLPFIPKSLRTKRKGRHQTISIILIILVLVTSIVLTCELETAWPSFLVAIAFFVFAARQ